MRARLVVQEVNRHAGNSYVAATPPLESKRMLFSEFATEKSREERPLKLNFIGVTKTHFNGRPTKIIFIRPPPELGLPKNMVCKLDRCMYGTRDAGNIWEHMYTDALLAIGFSQGLASPCCFHHKGLQLSCVVHGDDFTCLAVDSALDVCEKAMQQNFDVKLKGRLGGREGC